MRGIARIEAKLISPQYVVPFVKTNKNDRNDVEAIVEAASRPSMRFVSVMTVEQHDLQALHRIRELLVAQRVINQVRGILAERGIVVGKKPASFHRSMPEVLAGEDPELTEYCRSLAVEMLEHLEHVEKCIARCDAKLATNDAAYALTISVFTTEPMELVVRRLAPKVLTLRDDVLIALERAVGAA